MRARTILCALLLHPWHGLEAQAQRTQLIRTDRAVADSSWSAGFSRAFFATAIPDAVILWPGAPVVQGTSDAHRLLSGGARSLRHMLTWQLLGADLSADSTLGLTWGVTAAGAGDSAGPVIGRYIATWRREAGGGAGRWRLAALMITDAMPEEPAPALDGLRMQFPSLKAAGPTAPFVSADLEFARLAADSGAGVAFEHWAAPDAHTFVGAGMLVQGPAAIGRAVSGPATWRWHPVVAGASNDGSLGWTVGEAVITTADGHSGPSKYLTIWKRQPDGAIRFVTDGGNGRAAGP